MLTAADRHAYYRSALATLRFAETRRPTKRRFGADADARWKAFKGHLSAADRIELLLRDANAEWPGAFGARGVFGLLHSAEDEAFGAAWESLDAVVGEELWLELAPLAGAGSAFEALTEIAKPWGIALGRVEIGTVDAADRLLAVGPTAVASLAEVFARGASLDWADQVTCLATPFAHRQVAVAALAVVDAHKPARVLSASDELPKPRELRVVRSGDAAPEDLAALAKGGF